MRLELGHGVSDVVSHRVGAQVQLFRDLLRGAPLGCELEHLAFARREVFGVELLESFEVGQMADHVRSEVGFMLGGGPNPGDEIGTIGTLRQKSVASRVESLRKYPTVGGCRDHHDARRVLCAPKFFDDLDAAPVGQAVVDQHHIRSECVDCVHCARDRTRHADDRDVGLIIEKRLQSERDDLVIVNDHNADRGGLHASSLDVRTHELNDTFVSLLDFHEVIEEPIFGELRRLIDSQADIVELIATNAPLEQILGAVTECVETGWDSERTYAAIVLAGEDEGRSVFPGPALSATAAVRSAQLFPVFPPNIPKSIRPVIDGTALDWPDLGFVESELGVTNSWFVPMIGQLDSVPSWLALYADGKDELSAAAQSFLGQYARLALIAIEQHRGELRLHRLIAEERQRLAGVLHDDPIQAMTAVSLRVQRLARHVDDDATDLVVDLQKATTTAIERMRRLLIDLHPPTLDNDGLVSAIDVYLSEVLEPLDIECELIDDVVDEPSIETASLAYRLVAEALWNVAKHAKATHVTVSLHARAGAVEILVSDNGVGFDHDQQTRRRAGHMGLSACRALSARASGSWNVDSATDAGTTVTIRLPGQLPTRQG